MMISYKEILNGNKKYGGKIDNLVSIQENFNIPKGFFINYGSLNNINESIIKDKFSSEQYIIRSCANIEDGKNASFAGMFTSKIINNQDNLLNEIHNVYKSTDFENINIYKDMLSIPGHIELNFIVQEYIHGEYSGVYFSNIDNIESLEYVKGENSILVDGLVNASKINYNSNDYTIEYHVQDFYIDENLNKIPYGKNPELSDKQIMDLQFTFQKLKNYFNFEIDVEWTISKGIIYILQIRPVTV